MGGDSWTSADWSGDTWWHDDTWGETPCAFVTLKDGAEANAKELIAYCRANMAHFKAPKTVVFGTLPKTSTGKVQKFTLRERAAEH